MLIVYFSSECSLPDFYLISLLSLWLCLSQINMYNTNNVAMNLLPALANLVFCWMLCWWVIGQGPHQWSLKAGLLFISYWLLSWPLLKGNHWRQLLWFAKMYQKEILSYLLAEDSSCVSFLWTPFTSPTPSSIYPGKQAVCQNAASKITFS